MGILERFLWIFDARRGHKDYDPAKVLDKQGYKVVTRVNKGRFETLYLAERKSTPNGQRVAVKITKDSDTMDGERLLWRFVNSQHCIRLYDHFRVKGYSHFVCEYAQNGDVLSWLERTGQPFGPHLEQFARRITAQILMALDHCHSQGLAHLDIKWANVLLDEDLNAKLSGFGYMCSKSSAESICLGDSFYNPPEALTVGVGLDTMDRVDIWELGAALVHMLIGWYMPVLHGPGVKVPSEGDSDTAMDLAVSVDISNETVRLPVKLARSGVSAEAQDFVQKLLVYRADCRPSAYEALGHPWMPNLPNNDR